MTAIALRALAGASLLILAACSQPAPEASVASATSDAPAASGSETLAPDAAASTDTSEHSAAPPDPPRPRRVV